MTRDELEDLTLVALQGVQAMAPGEQLHAVLVVGVPEGLELGQMTYAVRGTHDDATSQKMLGSVLEALERKHQRPTGHA